jgi:hypothetical protein
VSGQDPNAYCTTDVDKCQSIYQDVIKLCKGRMLNGEPIATVAKDEQVHISNLYQVLSNLGRNGNVVKSIKGQDSYIALMVR